jgi:hypothetical protein
MKPTIDVFSPLTARRAHSAKVFWFPTAFYAFGKDLSQGDATFTLVALNK